MSTSAGKRTFIVASHAHWDREWYRPFQEFRLRLVEMVDELLDVLSNPASGYSTFNLDGQAVVVEDYLEIRPYNADKLKKLISDRKLLVGPWYILPDEFLVCGESYIHNLLMGKDISERFGHFPKVGYLPDCFGHIAQIPQILKGFDIDNILFWRGLGKERPYPEIYWQGPDGTKLFGLHMVDGYGDAHTGDCPTVEDKIAKFKRVVQFYHTYSQIRTAMMMHGVDHMPVDLDVVEVMKRINADDSQNAQLRHGTFEEYIGLLRKEQSLNWPTFEGMLRDTKLQEKTGAYILNGVLSARLYMKRANVQAQHELVRWAEPAAVMEKLLFNVDRRDFLGKAWMWLLRNHPHDSIGGCSVDAVHRQMMTRFEWCRDICESIVSRTMSKLTSASAASDKVTSRLAVFNAAANPVSDVVETEITISRQELKEQTWSDGAVYRPTEAIRGVRIKRSDGRPVDGQILGITEKMQPYPAMRELSPLRTCLAAKVRFWADDLPAMGYEKYTFELLNSPVMPTASLLKGPTTMENAFLKVAVNPNGTLNVTDKTTGKTFSDLLYFEDSGDTGDEYTYAKPLNDEIVTSLGGQARINVAYDGADSCTLAVEHDLSVPADIEVDPFAAGMYCESMQKRSQTRINLPIRTEVTLGKNARYLKVKTTLTNTAKWHRLRVMFPTNLKTDVVSAEQQYDVAEFPVIIRQPSAKVWLENQPTQYPQQDFVDLSDGKHGLAVFNVGLPEFEVVPTESRTVAITLLRAVGYLSRQNMTSRGNHAGPGFETPEAQCLGAQTCEYAIYPHAGNWIQGGVLPLSRQFTSGVKTFTPLPFFGETSTNRWSLLSVEGTGVALDACKPAEKTDATVIRVTNYSPTTQKAKITLNFSFKEIKFARLDETVLAEGPKTNGNTVDLEIGTRKIVTLMVK